MYNKAYKSKRTMRKITRYGSICILLIITGLYLMTFITGMTVGATGEFTPDPVAGSTVAATAEITISPTTVISETLESTPQPTPVRNMIGSIGDISLKAEYVDNRVFADDTAINAKQININDISESILQAIRAQERDQDIFSAFKLTLVCNGREILQETTLNIEIENKGIFASYEDIYVFEVYDNGTVRRIDTNTAGNYIFFSIEKSGVYVATGVYMQGQYPPATDGTQSNPTLQNGETAGIITLSPNSDGIQKADNDEKITPGTFVFWIIFALILGLWIGIGIGFVLWGRYKSKKIQRGPNVIGE